MLLKISRQKEKNYKLQKWVSFFSNIFRFIKLPQAMALDLGLYSEARRLSSYPQFANCGVRAVTGQ